MATIAPFNALRPVAALAKQVAARPYDVLNSQEARQEASGNPESFLHITKAEIDLPDGVDLHSQVVYDKAKENLDQFIRRGTLFQDEKPCYYAYQLIMPDPHEKGKETSQTGLVCVSSLADYDRGIIKKHELTRPDKEMDRINHIQTTGAQTGNVFMAYPAHQKIHQTMEDWKTSHPPEYDFIAVDGIRHILWVIGDPATQERLTRWFEKEIPSTYIADGHHRAASAAKVWDAQGKKPGSASASFLTTLFPSDQLHILDYNRLIKDLNGMTEQGFLKSLERAFLVGKVETAFRPQQPHQFGLYCNHSWYKLIAKEDSYSRDPIGILDITILQHNVLERILSIKDQRTDKRIDFVGGIRGLEELEKRVNSGEMKLAFSLYPVSIQQLFSIADSGELMPPKSTWFEPKLRDGLATHLLIDR
jgi:uncharacterized protein (DUF1015 family)